MTTVARGTIETPRGTDAKLPGGASISSVVWYNGIRLLIGRMVAIRGRRFLLLPILNEWTGDSRVVLLLEPMLGLPPNDRESESI